ncbi:MAG: thiamine phosphate synthase [Nitrospira sp.]|nr:thiamine phosphate synthase [Nitrospira sp.]MBH0194236.1 thiamine phosphate synthase [Nitrospira sp.]
MASVDFRLLLVTDRHRTRGRSLPSILQQAVEAGLPAIQLRERDLPTTELLQFVQEIRAITLPRAVPLIINDRVDLMLALNLDGVHLRANSLPVAAVRRLAGADRLIGLSTHSLAEVRQANQDGADYVVFGPIFDTLSKRQFGSPVGLAQLAEVCRLSAIPVFAIGGISGASVPAVRRAGSHGIAVIGSILDQEDPATATRAILAALTS